MKEFTLLVVKDRSLCFQVFNIEKDVVSRYIVSVYKLEDYDIQGCLRFTQEEEERGFVSVVRHDGHVWYMPVSDFVSFVSKHAVNEKESVRLCRAAYRVVDMYQRDAREGSVK